MHPFRRSVAEKTGSRLMTLVICCLKIQRKGVLHLYQAGTYTLVLFSEKYVDLMKFYIRLAGLRFARRRTAVRTAEWAKLVQ